jgi:chromosome segregation ATPase
MKEAGDQMASIAEQLAELKHRRDELESAQASVSERIAAAARDLEDNQAELDGLSAQQRVIDADVDATTKLESDMGAAASAIQDVRARGLDELAKVRQEHEALVSRIDQELSAERRAALSKDIDTIDEAIATATSTAKGVGDQLAAAETAAADARQEATAAAAAHEDGLQRLLALPQGIEAARARIVALGAAATTAVDAGRMAEAFVRARDLKLALDRLDEAVHSTDDEQLANELPGLWSETLSASDELTGVIAAVGPLQARATAAQQARDALVAGRDQHIAKILSEPPPAPPASSGGPGAGAAETPEPQ